MTIKILDEEALELPTGETGRIFIGSPLLFEGYTGGGTKEMIDGLMSTGDVGHFDPAGRLFIDGRDDDMIVSGGENVFPQEVEEMLIGHDAVADAAVFGVPDRGLRSAARGDGRAQAGRRRVRGRAEALRPRAGSRATRCPARSRSSTSCRGPRPGKLQRGKLAADD